MEEVEAGVGGGADGGHLPFGRSGGISLLLF